MYISLPYHTYPCKFNIELIFSGRSEFPEHYKHQRMGCQFEGLGQILAYGPLQL